MLNSGPSTVYVKVFLNEGDNVGVLCIDKRFRKSNKHISLWPYRAIGMQRPYSSLLTILYRYKLRKSYLSSITELVSLLIILYSFIFSIPLSYLKLSLLTPRHFKVVHTLRLYSTKTTMDVMESSSKCSVCCQSRPCSSSAFASSVTRCTVPRLGGRLLQYRPILLLACCSKVLLQYRPLLLLACYSTVLLQYKRLLLLACYSTVLLQYKPLLYYTILACYSTVLLQCSPPVAFAESLVLTPLSFLSFITLKMYYFYGHRC